MVGLLLSSPVFAEASKHAQAFRLIGYGLAIWAAAVAGCGFSLGFYTLLICRMVVGVGEASFVALAAPYVDDNAPQGSKARWLAIFFLCIPSGFALGFLYGGLVASSLGWRAAFLIEAVAAIPFILLFFRAPPMDIRGTHEAGEAAEHEEATLGHHHGTMVARFEEAGRDIKQLAERPVYIWVVAGMTFYTAVVSTLSFYGPQAATALFDMSPKGVDLTFGGITVLTGVVGTLGGGVLLDKWGSSLRNGSLLCALGLGIGSVLLISGFAFAGTFAPFCVLFALGQCAMFATMAPGNAVALWAVPPGLRPLAMSMSVVAMHILGDVPAPPLLGLLESKVKNWRISMSVLASLLALGAAAYGAGVIASKHAVDFRSMVAVGSQEESGNIDDEEEGLRFHEQGRKTPEQSLLVRGDSGSGVENGTELR